MGREKGNESCSVGERNLQTQGDLSGKVLRGTVACGQVSSIHSHPKLGSRVESSPCFFPLSQHPQAPSGATERPSILSCT